ncbi:hypothetical protein ACIO3S_09805 [Nocardioides sp. NPDC087217]|uniref:hypothetical protein n=1 Tax=Nocardioides sp. NPDC087217 TaxID=3364335 RepID=UPI00382A45ED
MPFSGPIWVKRASDVDLAASEDAGYGQCRCPVTAGEFDVDDWSSALAQPVIGSIAALVVPADLGGVIWDSRADSIAGSVVAL